MGKNFGKKNITRFWKKIDENQKANRWAQFFHKINDFSSTRKIIEFCFQNYLI